MKKLVLVTIIVVLATLFVAGAYASNFFTKKLFIEDFNTVNEPYKQALFQTGQGNRDKAVENFAAFEREFSTFTEKYDSYRPYVIRGDTQFTADLAKIQTTIDENKERVQTGNLTEAHLGLEQIRPIFNEFFRRNGLSMLSVALVDFHDQMERVLDASDKKDAAGVLAEYVVADEKLKAVEAELNDDGVQAIRTNLDEVKRLAEQQDLEKLPDQAAKLKSSYVKVYLAKG